VRAPSIRSVLTKRACIAITNYAFLAFSDITYLGILVCLSAPFLPTLAQRLPQPVMFAASVENGGLGLTPRSIGLVLGSQGVVTGVVQVFFFAPIHRRFGNKRTFVAGSTAYALLTLSLPVMNALARREMMRTMWTVVGVHVLLSCPAFMAFSESPIASHYIATYLTHSQAAWRSLSRALRPPRPRSARSTGSLKRQ
jgi:MFS family permease